MDNQLIQWLPLFGFGSVLTILIAIIGVGVGLWRNAGQAHAAIGKNIDDLRTEIRGVRTDLGAEIRGVRTEVRTDIQGVQGEVAKLRSETRTDIQGVQGEVAKLRSETRTDIQGVQGEVAALRKETRTDIQGVRNELSDLRKDVSGLQVEMGKVATDLGWIKNRMGGPIESERR